MARADPWHGHDDRGAPDAPDPTWPAHEKRRPSPPRWLMVAATTTAVILVGSLVTAGAPEPPPSAPSAADSEPPLLPRKLGATPPAILPPSVPAGYVVTAARIIDGAHDPIEPTIAMFGVPDLSDPLSGPVIMVGTLDGPISPGPSGLEVGLPSRSVDLRGSSGEIIEDGPVTWLTWRDKDGGRAIRFVAGRNVHSETLQAIAVDRSDLVHPGRWETDPGSVGPGLRLLSRTTFDTVTLAGPGSRVVRFSEPGRPDRDLSIITSPDADLAPALRFLVHDYPSEVRGHPGSAGPVSATAVSGRRQAHVWSDGASTTSVMAGPAVDDVELERLVQTLAPATFGQWEGLRVAWNTLPADAMLAPLELSQGESLAQLEGATSHHRWTARLRREDGHLLVDSSTASADGVTLGPFNGDATYPVLVGTGLRVGVTSERSPDGPGSAMIVGLAPAGTTRMEVRYKNQDVPVVLREVKGVLPSADDRSGAKVFFAGLVDLSRGRGRPLGHEPEPPWSLVAVDEGGLILDRLTAP